MSHVYIDFLQPYLSPGDKICLDFSNDRLLDHKQHTHTLTKAHISIQKDLILRGIHLSLC